MAKRFQFLWVAGVFIILIASSLIAAAFNPVVVHQRYLGFVGCDLSVHRAFVAPEC